MTPGGQSCSRAGEELVEYAYGELAGAQLRQVEEHLSQCAGCRAELDHIANTRRSMAALAAEPAPTAGVDSLLAYAEAAASRSRASKPRRLRWLGPAFSLGGLLAAAAVVFSIERPHRPGEMLPSPLAREATAESSAATAAPAAPSSKADLAFEPTPESAMAPQAMPSPKGAGGRVVAALGNPVSAPAPRPAADELAPSSARSFAAKKKEEAPSLNRAELRRSKVAVKLNAPEREDALEGAMRGSADLAHAGDLAADDEPLRQRFASAGVRGSGAADSKSAKPQIEAAAIREAPPPAPSKSAPAAERAAAASPDWLASKVDSAPDAAALLDRGHAEAAAGKLEASLATFAQFIERFPRHPRAPEAMRERIRLLERLHRPSEARAERQELLRRYPGSGEAVGEPAPASESGKAESGPAGN